MAKTQRSAEKKENEDLGNQPFNDLVYSLETKTFLRFQKELVRRNIFQATSMFTDPLPEFSYDDICEEVKKRVAKLDDPRLEDTRVWLRHPLRMLIQLREEERKALGEMHRGMTREEIKKKEGELEKEFDEIEKIQKKLEDLISTVEKLQEKTSAEKKITGSTHQRFEQLHLFEDNPHADT